jgi:hypothetical protein
MPLDDQIDGMLRLIRVLLLLFCIRRYTYRGDTTLSLDRLILSNGDCLFFCDILAYLSFINKQSILDYGVPRSRFI